MSDPHGTGPHAALELQRTAFRADGIPSAAVRRARVDALMQLISNNTDDLIRTMEADFGRRSTSVSRLADIFMPLSELALQRARLGRWMRPTSKGGPLNPLGFRQAIRRDPRGVVGVMAAWNFPVLLSLVPAGTALAAGNRVLLHPSPEAPSTAELLTALVGRYFDPEVFMVLPESVATGEDFAALPFDRLLFTGSSRIGALVGAAAARNLTPTTLELGGRNPVIVQRGSNVDRAAAFIADATTANAGQICLCPDYALVPREDVDAVAQAVLDRWRRTHPRVQENPEYTAIISDRHFQRITGLVEDARSRGARVISHTPAGESLPDAEQRIIPPTIVVDPPDGAEILEEETFGPIITIIGYSSLAEAIEHVASRPSPLCLYWSGDNGADFEAVLDGTRSGAVNVHDMALHLMSPVLPFGGVGASGYGAYGGRAGFETFTHARPVVRNPGPLASGIRVASLMGAPRSVTSRTATQATRAAGLVAGLVSKRSRRTRRRR